MSLCTDTTCSILSYVHVPHSTFIAIAYVDKYGRRSLLVYGAFSMALFCVIITLLSSDIANYKTDKAVAW
jgi:MFS family permease